MKQKKNGGVKAKRSIQWLYDMNGNIVGFEERVVMNYKQAKKIWGSHPNFPK